MRALTSLSVKLIAVLGLITLTSAAFADVTPLCPEPPPVLACTATGTGNITATMISGLSLININNSVLAFGSAVPVNGGTITIAPNSTRTSTGTVQPMDATPGSAAQFQVGGEPNFMYHILLPTSATIKNGNNSMTVNNFTSNPSGKGLLDGTGKQTLSVGGTLHVGDQQPLGNYTGTFNITVSYN